MGAGAGSLPSSADYQSQHKILAHTLKLNVTLNRLQISSVIDIIFQRDCPLIQAKGEPMFIHWGIVKIETDDRSVFIRPPQPLWPQNTDPRPGEPSMQSPFDQQGQVHMKISEDQAPAGIVFLVAE